MNPRPDRPRRALLRADDSAETTAPGLVPAPANPRALALLDDEVTVARDADAEAPRHVRAPRPRLPPVFDVEPATLPLDARTPAAISPRDEPPSRGPAIVPVVPAAPLTPSSLDDSMVELRLPDPAPIYRIPGHPAAPPTPRPFAPPIPAPPAPKPRTLAPPTPAPAPAPAPDLFDVLPSAEEDPFPPLPAPLPAPPVAAADESVDRPIASAGLSCPCSLRAAIAWRKANPGTREPELVAIAFARCLAALHERAIVLGERLIPENFLCLPDGTVEYLEALDPPPRSVVEQYLAPELFRGHAATVQTDVFGLAAVVYELLTARALKPAFLPQVLQSTRTDTWFSDPGPNFPEPYRALLRPALADRPAQRHADLAGFADELFRAWRIVHSPARRQAVREAPRPFWTRGVKIAVGVAAFVLALLLLAFFPVERLTAPPVPTVQPSLGP